MHPDLFQLGPLTVHTYSVLVDLGILAGALIAYREAKRLGIDSNVFADFALWVIVAGLAGSRLYHVFMYPDLYAGDWLSVFRLWEHGLVFQGAFLGGLIAGIIFVRLHRLPFWRMADAAALGLVFGHSIGRVACFFAGCCYGELCDLPWAVSFPVLGDGPRHPTQLYEALANLVIFGILLLVRRRKPFDGFVFLLYVALYSMVRFTDEFFRGDPAQMVGTLRLAQTVATTTFVVAVLLMLFLMLRARSLPDPSMVHEEETGSLDEVLGDTAKTPGKETMRPL